MLVFGIILLSLFRCCYTYEYGDRLASLIQSSHKEWISPWMDIPIQNMPRFRITDSTIIHVHLPHEEKKGNSPEIAIDLKEDVMVSLTFAANKLILPKLPLFDAKERKSIDKLVITFTHDQNEVISVDYKYIYGPRIKRIDPSHPSLTAFEITYRWNNLQEDDFPFAISMMFGSSLIAMLGLGLMVWSNTPKDRGAGYKSSSAKTSRPIR
jgi:hypothetical protein